MTERRVSAIVAAVRKDGDRAVIEVWNKIDLLEPGPRKGLLSRNGRGEVVAVSAVTGEGVPALLAAFEAGVTRDNITLTLAQTGSDQSVVQSQLDILDQTTIRLKSTLSEIEDLDYAKAVTQMNKEMLALQSAMGSFSKISGLSLFDYIN